MITLKPIFLVLFATVWAFSPAKANTTYIVQEGDTAEKIAESYLGSAEAAADLLAHNKLPAREILTPGTVLSLPIGLRERTRELIDAAAADLAAAKASQADEFAVPEFTILNTTVQRVNAAAKAGHFDLASTLASEVPALKERAVQATMKQAIQPGKARIVRESGTIEISTDEGLTWQAVKTGAVFKKGDRIRSQEKSKAILSFPDGTEVEMDPLSAYKIETLEFDKRNSAHDVKLQLLLGEIFGKIKSKKREKPFRIQSGRASIAVRGSSVIVSTEPGGVLRASNISGTMDVRVADDVRSFGPGEGVVARSTGITGPVKLPTTPVLQGKHTGNFITGQTRVRFDVDTRQAASASSRHKLEVSTDPDFLNLVHRRDHFGNILETDELANGTYHYRVSSLSDNGLQSTGFAQGTVQVEKSFEIDVNTEASHREADGLLVTGKGVSYTATTGNPDATISWIVNDELIASPKNTLTLDEEGFYEIEVQASHAGGKAEAQKFSVFVDASGPAIRAHLSEPISQPMQAPVRVLSILGEDTSGIGSMNAIVNGGKPEAVGKSPLVLSTALPNSVVIQATDLWGNRSERNVDIPASSPPVFAPRIQAPPPPTPRPKAVTVHEKPSERTWFERLLGIKPKKRLVPAQSSSGQSPPSPSTTRYSKSSIPGGTRRTTVNKPIVAPAPSSVRSGNKPVLRSPSAPNAVSGPASRTTLPRAKVKRPSASTGRPSAPPPQQRPAVIRMAPKQPSPTAVQSTSAPTQPTQIASTPIATTQASIPVRATPIIQPVSATKRAAPPTPPAPSPATPKASDKGKTLLERLLKE